MLHTVLNYWQYQAERGDKERPVWLLVSQGNIQPRGFIYGWATNKRHAQKEADKLIEGGEQIALLRLS